MIRHVFIFNSWLFSVIARSAFFAIRGHFYAFMTLLKQNLKRNYIIFYSHLILSRRITDRILLLYLLYETFSFKKHHSSYLEVSNKKQDCGLLTRKYCYIFVYDSLQSSRARVQGQTIAISSI